MKIPPPLHRWSLTPKQAIRLQQRLRDRVRVEKLPHAPRFVAGADMAFSPDGRRCVAGVVVYDVITRSICDEALAWRDARFPYVPGLLSFREAPAVLAAARKLRKIPDVFMFDAQGVAHPRRLGLASHAGILLDYPSIGCAKSRLCGEHGEVPEKRGGATPLTHNGEIVGAVLRTRENVKPVFASIGHRVTLDDATRVILDCLTRYRLPEPTRLAHILVTRYRTAD